MTLYLESTESLTPTRSFELNSIYLLHSVLYRYYSEIVSSSDNPLHTVLLDLGNMPDQVSQDQNRQVLLRLRLSSRDMLITQGNRNAGASNTVDLQSELRQMLLECLRGAPAVNLRQGDGLKESMDELLHECKQQNKYDAAGKVQKVIELLEATGIAASGAGAAGDQFLQATADEISKRARKRVQLVKERQDLQKIVEFVNNHNDALRRKTAAYTEYLEAVRESKVTVKNVYTTESLQRAKGPRRKKKVDEATAKKEEEERRKAEAEKIKTVMAENPTFRKLILEDAALAKYI